MTELRNTNYYYAVKCLKKDVLIRNDDVEYTFIERKVLILGTEHPYLCHLFCTFQTEVLCEIDFGSLSIGKTMSISIYEAKKKLVRLLHLTQCQPHTIVHIVSFFFCSESSILCDGIFERR